MYWVKELLTLVKRGPELNCPCHVAVEPTDCQKEMYAKLAKGKEAPACDENGNYPADKKCSMVAGSK
jgi:hypothetical protein